MRTKQNGGWLLRDKQARQLSTYLNRWLHSAAVTDCDWTMVPLMPGSNYCCQWFRNKCRPRINAAAFNRINTVYIGPCGTRLIMANNVVLFVVSNCWLAGKTFPYNRKTENLAEQHDVPVVDSSLVLVGGAQVVKWPWKFLSIDLS